METYEQLGACGSPVAGVSFDQGDTAPAAPARPPSDLFSFTEMPLFGRRHFPSAVLGELQTAGLSTSVQIITISSTGPAAVRPDVARRWLVESELPILTEQRPWEPLAQSLLAERTEPLAFRVVIPTRPLTLGAQPEPPYASMVWGLVERQQLRAARQLLDQLPDDPNYAQVRMLLQPAKTRPSRRRDVDRTAEYAWLTLHAREHAGHWVAVYGDSLVAVAKTLKDLRTALNDVHLPDKPLLHYVD